jgi:pimeloyl-ACP methyl ester carboxylesterase
LPLNTNTKGLRYYFLWFMGVTIPMLLLILDYFSLQRGVTFGKVVWGIFLLYLFFALSRAVRGTSPARFPVFENDPQRLGFQYQEATFSSRDGLELSGWFIPPKNRATIVLCHGFGGNRLMVGPIARLLIRHGFGVLMFEFRAHGRSQGDLSTWGWLEINDLHGALDYLSKHPEVDNTHIGALGYSLGGQVVLRTAPGNHLLKAVAVEGPSPAVLADHILSKRLTIKKIIFLPYFWLVYGYHRLLVGAPQPRGVIASMPKIAPCPLLLITSGEAGEKLYVCHLYEQANQPKILYEIPEARHTEGVLARPVEYEQKLVEFFTQALGVEDLSESRNYPSLVTEPLLEEEHW